MCKKETKYELPIGYFDFYKKQDENLISYCALYCTDCKKYND